MDTGTPVQQMEGTLRQYAAPTDKKDENGGEREGEEEPDEAEEQPSEDKFGDPDRGWVAGDGGFTVWRLLDEAASQIGGGF